MSHRRVTKNLRRCLTTAALIGAVLLAGAGVAGAQTLAGSSALGARQAAPPVDALWAVSSDEGSLSVCQDPTAPASISGCFGAGSLINLGVAPAVNEYVPVTDGTNVYFGSVPGYSCPTSQFGQGCTQVQIGWGGFAPGSVVASGGELWLVDGGSPPIYQCPANLPYTAATSMPAGCSVLGQASSGNAFSVAYANGQVFAGTTSGALMRCTVAQANACVTLFSFPNAPYVYALATGGGYVWAGLSNNQIWRCDPVVLGNCSLWETAAYAIYGNGLADDGQGNLWAVVPGSDEFTRPGSVIWSCPEAYPNGCQTVIGNVHPWGVTAGAGHGFSVVTNGRNYPPIAYGATQYPQSVTFGGGVWPSIVYVPSGGTPGLGGVRVQLKAPKGALARACAERSSLPATVVVRGPHRVRVVRPLDLCKAGDAARIGVRRHDLLYPGTYSVRVKSAAFSGTKRVVVRGNRTARLIIGLRALTRAS